MVKIPWSASLARVTGPTPHISSTGKSWRNASSVAGSTTTRPSGLAICEAILARCLVRATPTEIASRAPSERAGGSSRRSRPACRRDACTRDVGEGFVDRDPLHERREVAEDGDGRIAEALIVAEVPADEDELRAQLARLAAGHAAVDTERLRFVGSCEDHAAADGDWPAPQARIEQLLDGGIEGVQIRMEDGGLGLHDVTCPVTCRP